MTPYFKRTGESLFCDEYLFQEAMRSNANQFLPKINELVDWDRYTGKFLKLYKAKGTLGAPAYQPSLLLKVLFLEFLYKITDRDIERYINDSISMKAFLGLGFADAAPDHSTLSIFRDRIIKKGRTKIMEEVFNDIVRIAVKNGIKIGSIQVIDSTHTDADVNRAKDRQRRKPKDEGGENKPPRDPDAKTGVKRIEEVKTAEGKMAKIPKYIFGYKTHISVNEKSNMITSLDITDASKYDGHYFKNLMEKDLALKIAVPKRTIYTADKGYADGENNAWLNQHKLKDAIFYRGMKKIKDAKVKFTTYTSQKEFMAGAKKRYVVERTNGHLKKHIGLNRCRFLGINKMKIQSFMSAIVYNLKILVKSVYGTGFKSACRF